MRNAVSKLLNWPFVFLVVGLAIVATIWLLWAVTGLKQEPSASWLSIAGILVSAATVASVAFAIINYLEANAFQKRVDESIVQFTERENQYMQRLVDYKRVYRDIALNAMHSLVHTLVASHDEQSKDRLENLQRAEVDIRLLAGTIEDLMRAIELQFKLSPYKDFLELEGKLNGCGEMLTPQEVAAVRMRYSTLRKVVLDKVQLHRVKSKQYELMTQQK